MSDNFWSAIAGAVVGGLIAFGIQLITLRAAATQRKEEAAERRSGIAHSLLFKMVKIHSNLSGYKGHIAESKDRAKKEGHDGDLWQFVLPIANPPEKVHFTPDEMALLLSLKNDDLFNVMMSMDAVHNSSIDAFNSFSASRRQLTAMLPASMEGDVGTTVLSGDDALFVKPKIAELNSLLEQIVGRCDNDEKEALRALLRLGGELSEKLGVNYRLSVKKL